MTDKRYTVGVDMGEGRDQTGIVIVKRETHKKRWKPRLFPPDWLHAFCERLPRPFGLWIMTVWYRVPTIWKHGWGEHEDARRWKPLVFSENDLEFVRYRQFTIDKILTAFRIPADLLVSERHDELRRLRDSSYGPAKVHAAMLTMRQERIMADIITKWRKRFQGA